MKMYYIKIFCNIFDLYNCVSKIRMKYRHSLISLFLLLAIHLDAQDQVRLPDSITVAWQGGQMCYAHTVAPGETLYSLCRKFNTSIDLVYQFNPRIEGSLLTVGQRIWIPVMSLLHDPPATPPIIAVHYRVRPGETLFRIARIYLHQEVEALMARNTLGDHQIRPGQSLIIGWLPGALQSSDAQLLKGTDSTNVRSYQGVHVVPSTGIQSISRKDSLTASKAERVLKVKHTPGVAYQIQTTGGQKKYFALHNKAALNSYIEITNPMFNTRVLAKVIGKIPDGVYPGDIEIIVSPAVARDLHVLDRRFYVQLKYLY